MFRRSWALAVLILALTCAPAYADVEVQLRIEGDNETFYEGPVKTDGHDIDGHPCDGTNAGRYSSPRPTFTAALDDGPVDWKGDWNEDFEDFFITRIGSDDNTSSKFWGYASNYKASQQGGCQDEVKDGDDVLFGFDFFSKTHLLKLTGPLTAKVGEGVDLEVVDGQDGGDISGAKVEGDGVSQDTDGDGRVRVSFDSDGVKKLKAERDDSIRSNELEICVYRSDPRECASFEPESVSREVEDDRDRGDNDGDRSDDGRSEDGVGPDATAGPSAGGLAGLAASIRDGAMFRSGPRAITGSVTETGPLHQVYFRLRRIVDGECSWYSGKQKRFTTPGSCRNARFYRLGDDPQFTFRLGQSLPPGRYILDLKALDLKLNASREQIRFEVR